jgi:hypothetical protein
MDLNAMLIDGRGSLGAQVAVAGVEFEGGHVMGAVSAAKLHPALDASDGVEPLHDFESSLPAEK